MKTGVSSVNSKKNDPVYGKEQQRVLVSQWNGAGSGKAVGGRNPHRCEVSRKQSPGFIVPAGDGCQH